MEDRAYFQGCFFFFTDWGMKRDTVLVRECFQRWHILNWEKTGLEARSDFSEQVRKQNHIPIIMPKFSHKMMALWCERQQCQESNEASAKLDATQKTHSGSNSRWQGTHGKPMWRSPMQNFIFQRTEASVHRTFFLSRLAPSAETWRYISDHSSLEVSLNSLQPLTAQI